MKMKTDIIVGMLAMANAANGIIIPNGASTSEQLCKGTSFNEKGNWYCREVSQIAYQGVGTSGQYKEVISMDQKTGACQFANKQFSGPLAPFNEPVREVNHDNLETLLTIIDVPTLPRAAQLEAGGRVHAQDPRRSSQLTGYGRDKSCRYHR
jgi:hypothetical protein